MRFFFLLLPLGLFGACGGASAPSNGSDAGMTGPSDSATPDGHPQAFTCPPFDELCGVVPMQFCAKIQTDPDNCGGCGKACGAGSHCSEATCGATCTGLTSVLCSTTCVDTENDSENCGGCGKACPAGQVCSAGACAATCTAGYATCGSGSSIYCAETSVDPDNCGRCANYCGVGGSCSSGQCSTTQVKDAGPPIPDACVSTVEDCTNGVDDNCDGLVDCEDPQCTGASGQFSCASLPTEAGWTVVAFNASGQPACPESYASTASDVIVSASGAADTCGCNGEVTTPPTCQGNWAWWSNGTSPSCGPVPGSGGNSFTNEGCVNTSLDNLNTTYYFAGAPNGVHTQAGACNGTPVVMSKPAVETVKGETCALPQAGTGCSAGAVCAPKPGAGFQRCAISTTASSCPVGLIQTTVATSVSDTRGCGGCACSTSDLGCNVTGMVYFSNANCQGGNYLMTTTCTLQGGQTLADFGGNSYSYQAQVTNNGQANVPQITSTSQPTGGVTTSGSILVCCEP